MTRHPSCAGFLAMVAACVGVVTPAPVAQEPVWRATGVKYRYNLGSAEFAGDRDGDGWPEVVVTGSVAAGRRVVTETFILGGKTGRVLKRIPEGGGGIYTGILNTEVVGDVDGDGLADYARWLSANGPPTLQRIEVRSGKDDRVLWVQTKPHNTWLGMSMQGGLDFDGNGRADLLVTAAQGIKTLFGFNHQGKEIFKLPIGRVTDDTALSKIGDVDGDGRDDFIVQDRDRPSTGEIRVYSGSVKNGQPPRLIMTVRGKLGDDLGSGGAVGCGDADGDGVPDLLAMNCCRPPFGVYSGKTGKPIWERRLVGSGMTLHDFDGDGRKEFLTYIRDANFRWRQRIYSISTGKLLPYTFPEPMHTSPLSEGRDHRGFATFLHYEPDYGKYLNSPLGSLSRLSLMRTVPKGVGVTGTGCRATMPKVPRIGWEPLGTHSAAKSVRVRLSGAPPGSFAVLMLGVSQRSYAGAALPLPLPFLGLPQCSLRQSIDFSVMARTGLAGATKGRTSIDLPWPRTFPVYGQWMVIDQARNHIAGLTGSLSW